MTEREKDGSLKKQEEDRRLNRKGSPQRQLNRVVRKVKNGLNWPWNAAKRGGGQKITTSVLQKKIKGEGNEYFAK